MMTQPIRRDRPSVPRPPSPHRTDAPPRTTPPHRADRNPPGSPGSSPDEDAFDLLVRMLREWGLEELAPEVLRLLEDGRTQEQISILLQDTEAYKRRFAGNEARRKAGLAVLSPREYMETEAAYRQIMESAGLPGGFYDAPDDFAGWIGNDVSPSEIKTRVDLAVGAAERLDDGTRRAFFEHYGIGSRDLAAYFLDRERALPQLQRIARGVRISGAGFDTGITFGRERAEQLAGSDLVQDAQLGQAVGRVAEFTENIGKLSGMFGGDFTQRDAEQEVFFGSESSRKKRRDLSGREFAEFSGGSGVGRGSLSQSPGSF